MVKRIRVTDLKKKKREKRMVPILPHTPSTFKQI